MRWGWRGRRVAYGGGVDPRTRRIVTLVVLFGLVAALLVGSLL